MKQRNEMMMLVGVFILLAALSLNAAGLPADWQHEQPFNVAATGLIKLSLPVETLDAARPGLEDLRLYDDAGQEVPCLIEHPVPAGKVIQNARSFRVSLNPGSTVITFETGPKITSPTGQADGDGPSLGLDGFRQGLADEPGGAVDRDRVILEYNRFPVIRSERDFEDAARKRDP